MERTPTVASASRHEDASQLGLVVGITRVKDNHATRTETASSVPTTATTTMPAFIQIDYACPVKAVPLYLRECVMGLIRTVASASRQEDANQFRDLVYPLPAVMPNAERFRTSAAGLLNAERAARSNRVWRTDAAPANQC